VDDRETFESLRALMVEYDFDALNVRVGSTRFELVRREPHAVSTPIAPLPVAIAPAAAEPHASAPSNGIVLSERTKRVTAPVIGVFYQAPSPGADPFVAVGDRVAMGQTLCILEAMKMMNEITSDYAGVVTRVVASNGALVSLGEDLFWIE